MYTPRLNPSRQKNVPVWCLGGRVYRVRQVTSGCLVFVNISGLGGGGGGTVYTGREVISCGGLCLYTYVWVCLGGHMPVSAL